MRWSTDLLDSQSNRRNVGYSRLKVALATLMTLFAVAGAVFDSSGRVLAASSGDDIYRWVDEEGRVHYGDRAPDGGDADRIELKTQPRQPMDAGERRRLELVRSAQERAASEDLETHAVTPNDESTETVCRDARRNWGVLTEEMPVYWAEDGNLRPHWHGDTYQGERVYVADSDREKVRSQVEDTLAANCESPWDFDLTAAVYDDWFAGELCAIATSRLERAQRRGSRTPESELARMQRAYNENC